MGKHLAIALFGVVALVGALGTSPARAGDAPPADPRTDISILIADGLEIRELIRQVGLATQTTFFWSDTDRAMTRRVQGSLRFRVPADELLAAARDLLATHEVSLVPIGPRSRPAYFAIDSRSLQNQFILKLRPTTVELTDSVASELDGQTGLYVTTTLAIPGTDDVKEVRGAVQHFLTPNSVGMALELTASRRLLVTDYAPNVVSIWRFLKTLPARPTPTASPVPATAASPQVPPDDDRRLEFFVLAHSSPFDMQRVLEELLSPGASPSGGRSGKSAAPSATAPRIAIDAPTRQIVMLGTLAEIERARTIVTRLDVERPKPP